MSWADSLTAQKYDGLSTHPFALLTVPRSSGSSLQKALSGGEEGNKETMYLSL